MVPERLVEEALKPLTYRPREALRLLIRLVAQGYPLMEAARHAVIGRARAQYAWDAFRHICEELSGQVRDQLKGKGTRATAEELEQIRLLAELGLSCTVIAKQIGRNKNFVKENFEKARAGYPSRQCRFLLIACHIFEHPMVLIGYPMCAVYHHCPRLEGRVVHWARTS